jgi:transcriptional regulator with XRE-family HTH domain
MSTEERRAFSERLQQALQNADYAPQSPTQLAREFNVRFSGSPVTVHAARKWLVGEAIPTQDKLLALAQWLRVPAQWLRFGGDHAEASGADIQTPATELRLQSKDLAILESLQLLDDDQRHIVRTVIRLLVHSNKPKPAAPPSAARKR